MEKVLIGTLLSLAVGGGIYGLYVNYGARAVITQATSKKLLEQCALLQAKQHPDPAEIEAWMNAAKAAAPEIFVVNAIVGAAFNDKGQCSRMAIQVNTTLRDCAQNLQRKIPSPSVPSEGGE